MTIDEELNILDQYLRRLKIEYEIYFNNPSKKAPSDIEWKVMNLLRKFSDGGRMSFSQRYRYNEMAQRYAIYSDLWRKKTRIREEGYRHPQDALLSVQGVRAAPEQPQHHTPYGISHSAAASAKPEQPFTIQCSDAAKEGEKVQLLFQALVEAKKKNGESLKDNATIDSFTTFVKKKTDQIRKQSGCDAVLYSVEMQDGQVKLKARAKT